MKTLQGKLINKLGMAILRRLYKPGEPMTFLERYITIVMWKNAETEFELMRDEEEKHTQGMYT